MILARAVGLFVSYAAWRVAGLRGAGQVLIGALGAEDETTRTIAGILLVRAARKSEPLLKEALNKREHLPAVLTVIGSLGDSKFEPELRKFSFDADPDVAKAAKAALQLIEAQ